MCFFDTLVCARCRVSHVVLQFRCTFASSVACPCSDYIWERLIPSCFCSNCSIYVPFFVKERDQYRGILRILIQARIARSSPIITMETCEPTTLISTEPAEPAGFLEFRVSVTNYGLILGPVGPISLEVMDHAWLCQNTHFIEELCGTYSTKPREMGIHWASPEEYPEITGFGHPAPPIRIYQQFYLPSEFQLDSGSFLRYNPNRRVPVRARARGRGRGRIPTSTLPPVRTAPATLTLPAIAPITTAATSKVPEPRLASIGTSHLMISSHASYTLTPTPIEIGRPSLPQSSQSPAFPHTTSTPGLLDPAQIITGDHPEPRFDRSFRPQSNWLTRGTSGSGLVSTQDIASASIVNTATTSSEGTNRHNTPAETAEAVIRTASFTPSGVTTPNASISSHSTGHMKVGNKAKDAMKAEKARETKTKNIGENDDEKKDGKSHEGGNKEQDSVPTTQVRPQVADTAIHLVV